MRLARLDPHPALGDAVLLDVGALDALEADADAAPQLVGIEMLARGIDRQVIGRHVGGAGWSAVRRGCLRSCRALSRARRENQSGRRRFARRAVRLRRAFRSASCRAGRNRPGPGATSSGSARARRCRPGRGRSRRAARRDSPGRRRPPARLKCAGCEPGAWLSVVRSIEAIPFARMERLAPAHGRSMPRSGRRAACPFRLAPPKGASLRFRRLRGLQEFVGLAGVAELVDAPGLGPGIARCGGSSPFARTSSPALGRRDRGKVVWKGFGMQIVENDQQGLKRAYTVKIPAKEIEARDRRRGQEGRAAGAHARLPPRQGARQPDPQDARRRAPFGRLQRQRARIGRHADAREEAAPGAAAQGRPRRRATRKARTPS